MPLEVVVVIWKVEVNDRGRARKLFKKVLHVLSLA